MHQTLSVLALAAFLAAGTAAAAGNPAEHYRRGAEEGRSGHLDRAMGEFDEAIRLDPKFAKGYYGRA